MYWNLKAFFFSTEEKEILYLMNIGWTKKDTQYWLEKKDAQNTLQTPKINDMIIHSTFCSVRMTLDLGRASETWIH